MKITYTPNPLCTTVELDEHEKKELWYKLKIEGMVDKLFTVHYELKCKEKRGGPDMERIAEAVDPSYYLGNAERNPVDRRADELLEHYLEELQGRHVGDCTCFAMSCSKCNAESLLGIDTIKGLPKHSAHKIGEAFSYKDGDVWKERPITEALAYLRNYDPKPSWAGYEAHVPRWRAEVKVALEWLEAYVAEHFPTHPATTTSTQ